MRPYARITGLLILIAAIAPAAMAQKNAELGNGFGVSYERENFNDIDAWQLIEAELKHKFGFGGVTLRWNGAERFNDRGHQIEVDAYPSLRKGTYMYLNAGRSNTSFFPRWRYGAEIFQNLPHSFEFSVGARQLNFNSSHVTLYTGSLGKYRGNNWISFRPYVSHDSTGTSVSGGLQLRHYYSTADDYVGISGSYGSKSAPTHTAAASWDRWDSRRGGDGMWDVGCEMWDVRCGM
jgi:YaiO family outer membrane protein